METGMKRIVIVILMAAMIMVSIPATAGNNTGAVEKLFHAKCSVCHSDKIPLNMKKDQKGWEETVKLMQQKRPNFISDQEAKTIVNFLIEHSQAMVKGK